MSAMGKARSTESEAGERRPPRKARRLCVQRRRRVVGGTLSDVDAVSWKRTCFSERATSAIWVVLSACVRVGDAGLDVKGVSGLAPVVGKYSGRSGEGNKGSLEGADRAKPGVVFSGTMSSGAEVESSTLLCRKSER